jgi:hypothetical protein
MRELAAPLLRTAAVRPLVRCLADTAVAWDDEPAAMQCSQWKLREVSG